MLDFVTSRRGAAVALLAGGLLVAQPVAGALPDLKVNRALLARTVEFTQRTFASSDCELAEGCARASGTRRLMLFDVAIVNIGRADMVIGNPADRPEWFHFSQCHGHYHMTGFAVFRLRRLDGTVALKSRKQGFCFRDDRPYAGSTLPAHPYTCDYQGISRGWQDIYDQTAECQWLDITGVRPGDYYLEVTLNSKRWVKESNYDNNTARIRVRIPRVR
jgi:hypothetical protein